MRQLIRRGCKCGQLHSILHRRTHFSLVFKCIYYILPHLVFNPICSARRSKGWGKTRFTTCPRAWGALLISGVHGRLILWPDQNQIFKRLFIKACFFCQFIDDFLMLWKCWSRLFIKPSFTYSIQNVVQIIHLNIHTLDQLLFPVKI